MGRMSEEKLIRVWAENPAAFEQELPQTRDRYRDRVEEARKALGGGKRSSKPEPGGQASPPKDQASEG